MAKTRVVVVDDSALVRELLTGILSSDPAIEVAGVAPDPLIAREMIKALSPDVITLDVEMPHMNGISLAKALRETYGDVKVVFVTGYHVDHAQLGPHAGLLNKPFLKSDLIRMVEHVVPPVPTAAA